MKVTQLKFWIHSTKAGAGEIFYTLPLINNAINLPGLTQIVYFRYNWSFIK